MSFNTKSFCCIVLGFICTWFLSVPASLAQSGNPWMMFRQDASHRGISPFNGPLFPDIQWQRSTLGFTYSSPTIAEDAIYVASERELIALGLDGTERWSATLSESVNIEGIQISGIVSTPAVADNGTIYIGSLDDRLYAINPDGTIQWTYDTGDEVFSSPTIGPDGTIYVGSRSGSVFAMNPNGTLRWQCSFSGEFFSSPALSADGILYIGSTDNLLYALDTAQNRDCQVRWVNSSLASDEIVSSPAIGTNNAVYFGSVDGRVYAVDRFSGRPIWGVPFQTNDAVVSSPAIGKDGTVYVGSFDETFYAINGATGALKWSFEAGDIIAASPAIDDAGLIYITSLDGALYVLRDIGTEADLVWSYPTNAPIWASPSIGPGTLPDGSGRVYIAASGSTSSPGKIVALGQSVYEVSLDPPLPIAGEELRITVRPTGSPSLASGILNYRSAGESTFTSLPFTGEITIPGIDITSDGFVYYIEGLEGTFPSRAPEARLATTSVFVQRATTTVEMFPRRYKMISVPFRLNTPSTTDVLDEYGDYGPSSWRLLRWDGNDYREYPDINDAFEPGTAFFLVTSSGEPFDIEAGTSVNTSEAFRVELAPGWNQIGNPFGFPVSWTDVIRDPAFINAIAYYDGIEMIQDPAVISTLAPWEGYFVYNAADNARSIQIPPVPAEALAVENAGKQSDPPFTSRLQIIASLEGTELRDTQNWVGFHPEALPGQDPMDMIEAPPFGDHIRLSIGDDQNPYAMNYKPFTDQGAEWPLILSHTTSDDRVLQLFFVRDEAFPRDIQMALIDDDYGYARLIDKDRITVHWNAGLNQRRLRLAVGTTEYIEAQIDDLPVAPDEFSLSPNFPNPFRQTTTIQYQLSQRSIVSLIVYNALGQKIRTLVQTTQNPGIFEVTWNGRDASNREAPSGLYFYRLTTERFQASGRMALVR